MTKHRVKNCDVKSFARRGKRSAEPFKQTKVNFSERVEASAKIEHWLLTIIERIESFYDTPVNRRSESILSYNVTHNFWSSPWVRKLSSMSPQLSHRVPGEDIGELCTRVPASTHMEHLQQFSSPIAWFQLPLPSLLLPAHI